MADVNFAVKRFQLSTAAAGNTQDITISGFGTPKAAIFIHGEASADDTDGGASKLGVGWTDGTNENAIGFSSLNNQATALGGRGHRLNRVITVPSHSSSTEISGYSFNTWVTDGVQIYIDVQNSEAEYVTLILINGTDVSNVHVGYKDDLGTGTSAVDINTVGFEPDLVFISHVGLNSAPSTQTSAAICSFGAGHNDGSDTQRGVMWSSGYNKDPTKINSYISNTKITGQVYNDSTTWMGTIGSYDSSGFSITPSASAGSDVIFFLCLKFNNNPDIKLFDMAWPTSGNYAETNPGFTPDFGLIASLYGPSSRDSRHDGSCAFAVTAFDDSNISTINGTDEDNVATTNTTGWSTASMKMREGDGSTVGVNTSGYSLDSQGWDFTVTTNPSSQILGWGLAIGSGAAAATNPKGPLGHPLNGALGGPI